MIARKDKIEELAVGIEIAAAYLGRDKDGDGWERDNWNVTLRYRGREYSGIAYHMGTGHSTAKTRADGALGMVAIPNWKATPPTASAVVDSLLLDSEARDQTFDEWCDGFGYDTDSRKAEAMYKACAKTGLLLARLLGSDFERFRQAERL